MPTTFSESHSKSHRGMFSNSHSLRLLSSFPGSGFTCHFLPSNNANPTANHQPLYDKAHRFPHKQYSLDGHLPRIICASPSPTNHPNLMLFPSYCLPRKTRHMVKSLWSETESVDYDKHSFITKNKSLILTLVVCIDHKQEEIKI